MSTYTPYTPWMSTLPTCQPSALHWPVQADYTQLNPLPGDGTAATRDQGLNPLAEAFTPYTYSPPEEKQPARSQQEQTSQLVVRLPPAPPTSTSTSLAALQPASWAPATDLPAEQYTTRPATRRVPPPSTHPSQQQLPIHHPSQDKPLNHPSKANTNPTDQSPSLQTENKTSRPRTSRPRNYTLQALEFYDLLHGTPGPEGTEVEKEEGDEGAACNLHNIVDALVLVNGLQEAKWMRVYERVRTEFVKTGRGGWIAWDSCMG